MSYVVVLFSSQDLVVVCLYLLATMLYLLFFVLYCYVLGDLSDAWQSKYISSHFSNSSAAAYYHAHDPKVAFTGMGVFLLGTMKHAVELGEQLENGHGDDAKYYERSVAARATWAKHAKVFYIVTGNGDPEQRVYKNETSCRNETLLFRKMLHNFHYKPRNEFVDTRHQFEVYNCGDPELRLTFLHLPRCEATYAGAEGPCCRCEGAMLFFLALHKHHKSGNDAYSSKSAFPDWFLFADDDYYVRLNYLYAIVNKAVTPARADFSQNKAITGLHLR